MDVEEDGVDRLGFQRPQGLGAGGGPMDDADPVIPAEQEHEFLHGGQLVVGDEDINHGSRVLPAAIDRFPPRGFASCLVPQASWRGWDFGTRMVIRVPSPGAVSTTSPLSLP